MLRNVRTIGAIAAGITAATLVVLSAATNVLIHRHPPLKVVPQRYAVLTQQQRIIYRLARRDGVGSGILYVWGGTSTRGFDCSGFIQHVEAAAGLQLPRTSEAMWSDGGRRVPRRDLRVGDVLFFSFSGGDVGHVGLSLGGRKFVEYYTSGRPARYGHLPKFGYVGARRWYWPVRIRQRTFFTARWVARHFHVKIAGHAGDTVVFVNRRHHGRFPRWKRRAMLAWAQHGHHAARGYYKHINIRLYPG